MFVRFLTTADPFKREFNPVLAQDFYEGVRCGLLHEARTKKGWRILAGDGKGASIDGSARIVYRDNLQRAFHEFVDWYGTVLPEDRLLQKAFLRKFDSLCKD